jgi:hypothetical protein
MRARAIEKWARVSFEKAETRVLMRRIKGGGALEKYIAVKSLEHFINKDLVLERFVPFRRLEVINPARLI